MGAIDIGPTRTRLAVGDLKGERLTHDVVPTPSGLAPPDLLAHLAASLQSLLREAEAPAERLLAVVAGAPGAVDRDRGMVSLA